MSTVSAVERRHFPRRSSSDTSVALKTPGPSSLSWLSSRRVQKFRVRARQRSERHWENAVHGFFSESCGHTDTHGDTSAAYTNIYRRNNMKIFFFFFFFFLFSPTPSCHGFLASHSVAVSVTSERGPSLSRVCSTDAFTGC